MEQSESSKLRFTHEGDRVSDTLERLSMLALEGIISKEIATTTIINVAKEKGLDGDRLIKSITKDAEFRYRERIRKISFWSKWFPF